MEATQLMTMKEVASRVGRPAHRVIHLCETGLVRPTENPSGRGKVRRFDREDVFRVGLALDLQDAGLTIPAIKPLMKRLDVLKKDIRASEIDITEAGITWDLFDVVWVIQYLGSDKAPVLSHLMPPNTVTLAPPSLAAEDSKFRAALQQALVKGPVEPLYMDQPVTVVTNLNKVASDLGL